MSDYDGFARLYDLEHQCFDADLELYRNYAMRCDGPILELGCGSGRVCLALAESGFDVTGVDASVEMLALARRRAAASSPAGQVRLEQIDVCAMPFEQAFALAIYPLNGFLHLLSAADQRAALRGAHRALLPGGFLIVDLPNPHAVFVPQEDGQLVLRSQFAAPDGHSIASLASTQTDLAAQRQYLTLFYDEIVDGVVRRTAIETELRFVYRYEMTALLHEAGFTVDGVYGSYDLDPYQADATSMLFVAHA